MYVWRILYIEPSVITPEKVKGYQRQNMSHFWEWILDNKNDIISIRGIRAKIIQYKDLLSKLHELYNFNIKFFPE